MIMIFLAFSTSKGTLVMECICVIYVVWPGFILYGFFEVKLLSVVVLYYASLIRLELVLCRMHFSYIAPS